MTIILDFTLEELHCIADALACLRRHGAEARRMGHRYGEVTELRARIRAATAQAEAIRDDP